MFAKQCLYVADARGLSLRNAAIIRNDLRMSRFRKIYSDAVTKAIPGPVASTFKQPRLIIS